MSEKLQVLVNKHIERIGIVHDYLQVFFFDGTIINIFNSYSIVGAHDSRLIGYEITAVKQNKDVITLFLLPEGAIQVGLQDSDYRGPEAMEYIGEDGPRIVWP